MKPQLDKIRAEAAFDREKCFEHLEPMVCYDRTREDGKPYRVKVRDRSTSVDLAMLENARLTPIIEKLLRVVECQGEALEFYTKRAAYELKDSFHLSAHHDSDMMADCGDKARMAQAEVLRILEGE